MKLGTAIIVAGLAASLGTGAVFAQPGPGYPAPSQQEFAGLRQHTGNGKRAQINEAVRNGSISKSEGRQLKQQLKAEKAQRRAEKQARRAQRGYQPANYPVPPAPQ